MLLPGPGGLPPVLIVLGIQVCAAVERPTYASTSLSSWPTTVRADLFGPVES